MRKNKFDLFPYVLLSPAMIVTLVIIFIPIVQTFAFSMMNYVLWKPKERGFVFLDNFASLLEDPVFCQSFKNTLVWIAGVVALQLLLGFAAALLLNRRFWWRGIARSLILIPWVTPSVITALMWRWMYDGNSGIINDLLVRAGILKAYFPFLADAQAALPAVMVALMWQGFPFFAIMILAGLQAIPPDLYEAAEVDGAGVIARFVKITLPMILPILFTSILLRIIWVANSLDIIYIMTGGGPGYNTHTLPVYSYLKAYKGLDFGYASALAVLLTILLAVIVAGYVSRVLKAEER